MTILLAAARLGANCAHAGAIGTGPNGDLIRQVLAAEGIDYGDDPVGGKDTGECFVMVEPSAERTFVTTYGAERDISAASLSRTMVQPADLVCVSGYSLYAPTKDRLLSYLEQLPSKVRIVLDPGAPFAGFAPELRERMCEMTSGWTSNAAEARDFSGADDLSRAMVAIAERFQMRAGVVGCPPSCCARWGMVASSPTAAAACKTRSWTGEIWDCGSAGSS